MFKHEQPSCLIIHTNLVNFPNNTHNAIAHIHSTIVPVKIHNRGFLQESLEHITMSPFWPILKLHSILLRVDVVNIHATVTALLSDVCDLVCRTSAWETLSSFVPFVTSAVEAQQ